MHKPPTSSPDTRLFDYRLLVTRLVALMGAAFGVGSFVVRLPGHYADLQRVCTGSLCPYGQLSPGAAASFQSLSLSLVGYAALRASLTEIGRASCRERV